MTESDKYVDLVTRLMRLTSQGSISWQTKRDRISTGLGQRADVYEANYKGRTFVLQDAISFARTKTNQSAMDTFQAMMSAGSYRLEVSGPGDKVIYFPPLQVIDNLARLVKGREANELDELKDLLSDD